MESPLVVVQRSLAFFSSLFSVFENVLVFLALEETKCYIQHSLWLPGPVEIMIYPLYPPLHCSQIQKEEPVWIQQVVWGEALIPCNLPALAW